MKGSKVRILNHLEKFSCITSAEAFQRYGITRLAARIKELRDKGYDIRTSMCVGENRYGETVRYAEYLYFGKKEEQK